MLNVYINCKAFNNAFILRTLLYVSLEFSNEYVLAFIKPFKLKLYNVELIFIKNNAN